MFPNYSEDPESPYFIESLSYSYESGSDKTREFMTKAGMCMGRCPEPELDLYNQLYPLKKQWYNEHKSTTPVPTTEAPVPTTEAPVPTTEAPVPTTEAPTT